MNWELEWLEELEELQGLEVLEELENWAVLGCAKLGWAGLAQPTSTITSVFSSPSPEAQ